MKKPKSLYLVELHGDNDHEYFLIEKSLLDWINNDVPFPKKYIKRAVDMGIKRSERNIFRVKYDNARALLACEIANYYFSDVLKFAQFVKRTKFTIKKGFYGYLF